MNNKYKYVIIVPNYNNDHGNIDGKTFLANSIESILSQTYTNFVLIIVDDCSTDSSLLTIDKYMDDDRVILIKNKRKRYNGGSRNVAIEYALDNIDFDYFCFVDSDDWWIDDNVLFTINESLDNHELMLLGYKIVKDLHEKCQETRLNYADNYIDLFDLNGAVLCSAWSRVIRKDKIVYFCEDTLMEDRVWSYKLADNINFENIINLKKIVYCWNRFNSISVSNGETDFWKACAYCHIGHFSQFLSQIKHKELLPVLEERLKKCKELANSGIFTQY